MPVQELFHLWDACDESLIKTRLQANTLEYIVPCSRGYTTLHGLITCGHYDIMTCGGALQSLHYTGPGRSFWHLQGGYGKGGLAGAIVDLGGHYHYGMWWTTKDPGRSLWHLYKLVIINLGGGGLQRTRGGPSGTCTN